MRKSVIVPYIDCIVRDNCLEEAYKLVLQYDHLIMENNIADNKMMWMSVLNGCNTANNTDLAQTIYDQIRERFGDKAEHQDYMSAASTIIL